ncbi:MAG: ATP-binding protein [bacterium]|nr:ATP-binding protein [bacterium]
MTSRQFSWVRGVIRVWNALTEPSHELIDAQQRRTASMIAAALITYLPILALTMMARNVFSDTAITGWALTSFAGVTICYVFSRTRYARLAGFTALFILWITPPILIGEGFAVNIPAVLFVIEWTLLALMLAFILLEIGWMLAFLAVTFVGMLFTGITFDGMNADFFLTVFSVFMLAVGMVIPSLLLRLLDRRARHEIEHSLREREEHYRLITQLMSDYAYSATITPAGVWRVEWVEGAWNAITGLPEGAQFSVNWPALVHPDDFPEFDRLERLILANQPQVREYRIFTQDRQSVRWIRDYSYPVWDDLQKRVARVYGAVQDITRRKLAEQNAAEQQRLAESLRDMAGVLSSTLDRDEVLDRLLDQVMRVLPTTSADIILVENGLLSLARARGYESESQVHSLQAMRLEMDKLTTFRTMYITGQPMLIPDTAADPDWTLIDQSKWIRSYVGAPIVLDGITMGFIDLNGHQPNQFHHGHAMQLRAFANQAAVAIRNALLFDEVRRYADALGMIVIERNNELTFERERLRAILEASGEGVVYTEGVTIHYANAAFGAITGYSIDDLIGQPFIMLRPPGVTETAALTMWQDIRAQMRHGIWRGEIEAQHKDSTVFTMGLTASLVSTGDDATMRMVTIVRDVTREKALRQQQSQFVAHASHELRTPITNFMTRLHLLRRDPANLETHLQVMEEVSERMRRLVNDLLDLSRFERGAIPLALQVLPVQALVARVVRAQHAEADRKGVRLTVEFAPVPLHVRVDEERLIQVITNLVTNAINYTPPGGTVQVTLKTEPDAQTGEARVLIRVRDTGIGIAPEHLPLIFQPFYRVATDVVGTGLGLSIARELMRQLDGTIHVTSQPGVGSTFTMDLPLVTP